MSYNRRTVSEHFLMHLHDSTLTSTQQHFCERLDVGEEVLGGEEDVSLIGPLALLVIPEAPHALLAHPAGARQRLECTRDRLEGKITCRVEVIRNE